MEKPLPVVFNLASPILISFTVLRSTSVAHGDQRLLHQLRNRRRCPDVRRYSRSGPAAAGAPATEDHTGESVDTLSPVPLDLLSRHFHLVIFRRNQIKARPLHSQSRHRSINRALP